MSNLTEQDILQKFDQSFKEARDACEWLAKNQDPMWLAPRGIWYRRLKTAMQELEGCARQMAAFRSDTRWLPLGIIYGAKASRLAQTYFVKMNWKGFGELIKLFNHGAYRAKQIAEDKTGVSGMILPKRTDFLILPDHRVPTPNRGTMH